MQKSCYGYFGKFSVSTIGKVLSKYTKSRVTALIKRNSTVNDFLINFLVFIWAAVYRATLSGVLRTQWNTYNVALLRKQFRYSTGF